MRMLPDPLTARKRVLYWGLGHETRWIRGSRGVASDQADLERDRWDWDNSRNDAFSRPCMFAYFERHVAGTKLEVQSEKVQNGRQKSLLNIRLSTKFVAPFLLYFYSYTNSVLQFFPTLHYLHFSYF